MTPQQRVEAFASFLGLPVEELKKIASRHRFGSRSTFARIERASETGRDARNDLAMRKLARLVSRDFLETLPADQRFLDRELTWLLLAVRNMAQFQWTRFLTGRAVFPPTRRSLEEVAAERYEPGASPDRPGELQRLRKLIDDLDREARGAGLIRATRAPETLLHWDWSGKRVPTERWLRMRRALCLAQTRLEDTAALVYLAAPILPLMLFPRRLCQQHIAKTLHDEAAAHVENQYKRRRRAAKSPDAGAASEPTATSAEAIAAGKLLKAYSWRYWCLRSDLGKGQAVIALFSAQRTRQFLAESKVGDTRRLALVRHVRALVEQGLILLDSPMTAQDEQDLPASLSVSGDTPGVSYADEIVMAGARERAPCVALAESDEYRRGRACIERLANHPQTRRVAAADVSAALFPQTAAALDKRARRDFELDPWHYLDF